MQEVKIIYVDSLTDLEPERNYLVEDTTNNKRYRGTGTGIVQIYDAENPQPIRGSVSKKTTTYTLDVSDFIIECDGTFTVTLFSADTGVTGQIYFIKNIGSGTITVDADGTDLIDGAGSITLAQWEVARLCVNSDINGFNVL